MNNLFYVDKSIKIDSFLSMFHYAISKVTNYNKADNQFLDDLFDFFIKNIKVKSDILKLNDELDLAYFYFRDKYPYDRNVNLVISYLMAKSHDYLAKQGFSVLK